MSSGRWLDGLRARLERLGWLEPDPDDLPGVVAVRTYADPLQTPGLRLFRAQSMRLPRPPLPRASLH